MFKKELRDTVKTLLLCMFVSVLFLILKIFLRRTQNFEWDFLSILNLLFNSTIIIFAALSGISLFLTEKRDRAFEYLFSLPISRLKLISIKVFPRISILILLIIIGGIFTIFESFYIDGLSLLILFLMSIFVSLAVDSIILGLIGIIILSNILYFTTIIIKYLGVTATLSPGLVSTPGFFIAQLFPAFLLLLPLGISFWKTFKQMDLKPLNHQIKPYLLYSLPTVIIYVSFIMICFKGYMSWIERY